MAMPRDGQFASPMGYVVSYCLEGRYVVMENAVLDQTVVSQPDWVIIHTCGDMASVYPPKTGEGCALFARHVIRYNMADCPLAAVSFGGRRRRDGRRDSLPVAPAWRPTVAHLRWTAQLCLLGLGLPGDGGMKHALSALLSNSSFSVVRRTQRGGRSRVRPVQRPVAEAGKGWRMGPGTSDITHR